jgi:hypothetical protein
MPLNDTYYVTVSPKTHYWRGENNTLHITAKDLFGGNIYRGQEWFNSAHRYEDTGSIRVKNRDTGGVVQFAFYTAVQSPPTSYLNRKHHMISYKATIYPTTSRRTVISQVEGELGKPLDLQLLELYLMVWENENCLAAYRRYMTEDQRVKSN